MLLCIRRYSLTQHILTILPVIIEKAWRKLFHSRNMSPYHNTVNICYVRLYLPIHNYSSQNNGMESIEPHYVLSKLLRGEELVGFRWNVYSHNAWFYYFTTSIYELPTTIFEAICHGASFTQFFTKPITKILSKSITNKCICVVWNCFTLARTSYT
jgi:hypothetical protein